ncbi:unnamed protein product [Didymodactylos carnosus]|uniref:Small EDRK-rich factor-like N-terminal domain-containing protein n=2 Tax=Didymodactylos carnosus TaxID=1234261 RepID=A0A8S2EHG4_9BILA|nr:unnamed protein product [Didymodactylos carnosus]CAF4015994.1 unnamed protein product [Didymodactylos carnosus]
MARGHQKAQSQARNAEKQASMKKPQSQLSSAAAGLKFSCSVCKAQMPDPKTYRQHFENKHPKNDLPDELKEVEV